MEELKTKEERTDKHMHEVMKENKNLVQPLQKANERVSCQSMDEH